MVDSVGAERFVMLTGTRMLLSLFCLERPFSCPPLPPSNPLALSPQPPLPPPPLSFPPPLLPPPPAAAAAVPSTQRAALLLT